MYHKKKKKGKYIVLVVLLVVVIVLTGIAITIRPTRDLTAPEKVIKDTVLFINKIVVSPFRFIGDMINESSEKKDLYKKYVELKKKVDNMSLTIARKEELEKMVNDLEETLKLNQNLSDNMYLNASVINRDIGYWYNTITIDKGLKNGVSKDMAVIVPNGLIGKISSVSNYNSTVKLLTTEDVNNKISVKINNDGKYVYGLLTGYDKKNEAFIVEGISENTSIKKDSLVTTTGLGDIFPSGIIIGKVNKITTDNFDLAKIVEVKSDVDFNDITVVTVLKRKDSK